MIGIFKYKAGSLERNLMLCLIRSILVLIPFITHYVIVVTNIYLRKGNWPENKKKKIIHKKCPVYSATPHWAKV